MSISCPSHCTSGQESPVPTEQSLVGPPESVWTLWGREKSPTPIGIRTPDRPAPSVGRYADCAIPARVKY